MEQATEILSLIGNTPLVQLKNLDTGPCQLFVKLESHNPAGSIKDRIAVVMVQEAEKAGLLKPGGTMVEATAGNTGLALALVARLKGYRLILVIPDKMSREKTSHLRAMGVEVVGARSDVSKGHPEYYQEVAARIAAETPGGWYVNQFENPANPLTHELTTGPEIWEQSGHNVDAIVAGVGSGGTMTGLSRFFARVAPNVEMVLADPVGSILKHYVDTGEVSKDVGSWIVEGIGEDFIPKNCDLSRCKKAYSIPDQESLVVGRELLRKEGILGGSSCGTLLAAALRYCREQTAPKRVVTFICDTGNKYLSKMFNDYWMADQGFLEKKTYHDLRDLIARKHQEQGTVIIQTTDTLLTALNRMKMYDISQLPVMQGDRIVGLIDEYDLLLATFKEPKHFKSSVDNFMSRNLRKLSPTTSIDELLPIFSEGMVGIVEEGHKFLGLITQMDMLNFLRRKLA
jgi:cystathionine beta-synthase